MNYSNGTPVQVGDTILLNEEGTTPSVVVVVAIVEKKNKPNLRVVPITDVREASSANATLLDDVKNAPASRVKKAKKAD